MGPQILNPNPDRLSVVVGNTISMQCRVSGIPQPSLLWLHNGKVLLQTTYNEHISFLSNETLLQLSDVTTADAGKYTCHAENEAGFAEKVFHLDVWGKRSSVLMCGVRALLLGFVG